jgi:hypothetical protein
LIAKIVVSGGIAPSVQFFEPLISLTVPHVHQVQLVPQLDSETGEVLTNIARTGISSIECTIEKKVCRGELTDIRVSN